MGLLKGTNLTNVSRGLLKTYENALKQMEPVTKPIVVDQKVGHQNITHVFKQGLSDPRAWIGERKFKDNKLLEINTKCVLWENSFDISILDLADETISQHQYGVEDLAISAKTHQDVLVAALLNSGTSTSVSFDGLAVNIANYDGAATFGDHTPEVGDVQSNNLTSTALSYANLQIAYDTMRAFKNDMGQSIGMMPKYLVVPSALASLGHILTNNTLLSDGVSSNAVQVQNIFAGRLQLIVLDRLSSDTAWFLLGEKGLGKPFSHYTYLPPDIEIDDGDPVRKKAKVDFLAHWCTTVGFGPWQYLLRAIQ